MAVRQSPLLPITLGWATGEDGWGGDMNENLAVISALAQPVIESLTFSAPPPEAAEWMMYYVSENPINEWAGQGGKLALLLQSGWLFFAPTLGFEARLRSQDIFIWWNGTEWLERETGESAGGGGPTDGLPIGQKVLYSRPGRPASNEKFIVLIDEPLVLPAGADRSQAMCDSPAAAPTFFTLYRNSTSIGTLTFRAGEYVGEFAISDAITFGAGDRFIMQAPEALAEGISDIAITFRFLFTST